MIVNMALVHEVASGLQSALLVDKDSDEAQMEECDSCSEVSEFDCSQSMNGVYSVIKLNESLDQTKGEKG